MVYLCGMTRTSVARESVTVGRRWEPGKLADARLGIYTRASDDSDETETSVMAQEGYGEQWAVSQGITDIEKYCDNDKSASWYATKERTDFGRLLADIKAGRLDLVWFWKLNRSQRDLRVYVDLRDLCREHGVGWVIKRRLYDLDSPEDLRTLGNDAVNGEIYSIELSENVKLGHAMAAQLGKPHGSVSYGYKRRYDDRGKYVETVPDDALREAIGADGASFWYSPAAVVKEIITRVANREKLRKIARSLTERGIPRPRTPGLWKSGVVRNMALNRAYIGILVFNGEVIELEKPPWKKLVDEKVFYEAGNVLRDPSRRTAKSWRAVHLLTNIALCGVCGEGLTPLKVDGRMAYRCGGQSHAFIDKIDLEEFVERVLVGYLSRQDVAEYLKRVDTDGDGAHLSVVHAELERLRGELEKWRRLSESGEADALTAVRTINGLRTKIKAEETKVENASLPPVLRGRVGPNAAEIWKGLDLEEKREMLRACVTLRVAPNGQGRRGIPVSARVRWRWLVGPGQVDSHDDRPDTQPPKISDVLLSWFTEHGAVRTTADARAYFKTLPYQPHDKWLGQMLRKLAREGHLVQVGRGTFVVNRKATETD